MKPPSLPILLCALCALCGSAFGTTLTVDGVGASPEHFARISDALIALGASGLGTDGASDEIAIATNVLLEPRGFVINGRSSSDGEYPPVRDSLTIEGDGDKDGAPCQLAVGDQDTARPTVRITIAQAVGQAIALRHLILMLDFESNPYTNFFLVTQGDPGAPLTGASLTLEDVVLTASLPGNVPQDPDDRSVLGNGVISGFGEYLVFEVLQDVPGSSTSYRFANCVFAHQSADVVQILCDQASVEVGDVRITDNADAAPDGTVWGTALAYFPAGAHRSRSHA